MTKSPGFQRLRAACRIARAGLTRTIVAAAVGLGGALVLVLSFLPASVREGRGSLVPLLFAVLLWAAIAAAIWIGRALGQRLRPTGLAEEADKGAGLGQGDVRAALEIDRPADAAGSGLAEYHRRRVANALAGVEAPKLLPDTVPVWRERARRAAWVGGVIGLAIVGAAVARPQPTLSAAVALGAPWKTAFPSPLPMIELDAPNGVRRGQPATVGITAAGRERVVFSWRAGAQVIERRELEIGAGGEAEGRTGPIDVPTRIWVEDPFGGSSDTLIVRPREPLLVQDLQVVVEYPAYLGRGSETHRGQIPPLVAPEGARIRLSGEANLPLDAGALRWVSPEGEASETRTLDLQISGSAFGADWVPRETGSWRWELEASESMGDPVTPDPIRVLVVPDLQPRIQLLYPAPDTTLGYQRVMPLVVDVEDDIGLRRAVLRSWRSGLGEDLGERREALSPDPAGAQRSVFRHVLDRSTESFLPGDTLFYQIEAYDGHPSRGPARSDVFMLRVPTFTEVREERAEDAESLSDAAAELEEAIDALTEAAADAARQTEADGGDSEEARFEATEEARSVLDEAQRAQEDLEALEEDLQNMRDELEASSLTDQALEEQLRQLSERYEALAEEGLTEQLDALEDALRDLDPEAVREALEQLAQDSEAMREQLEQTLGMLEQAALEQAMKSAQANADELAEAQRQLSQETDAEAFAEDQQSLQERAEELAERLDELEAELSEADRQAAADSAAAAGERTDQALQQMAEAQSQSGESQSGQSQSGESQAGESQVSQQQQQAAQEAAEALEQAASALGSAEQEMSGESGEAAVQSLARARNEALSLAEEEGRLAEATRGDQTADPESWRAQQNAVRQGLENLLERLSDSGNEAAMLDQRTGAAAGEAIEQMDQLLERLAEDGARRLPSRAEAEGIQETLNELAQHLLASEQAAQAAQQQQSAGQEATEQMNQLAQQQQAITQETSSMLMPGPQPTGQERQEEIARRQEEIAEELSQLEDPEGDLLGRPEELAEEAAALARDLELQGPTQETLERQRQLFQRMLDAGRSLEDEDLDPNRRESEAATADAQAPPEIDPDLLRGRRFPLPSEAVLRELPLFYRTLIFEYFDRLNRSPAPRDP